MKNVVDEGCGAQRGKWCKLAHVCGEKKTKFQTRVVMSWIFRRRTVREGLKPLRVVCTKLPSAALRRVRHVHPASTAVRQTRVHLTFNEGIVHPMLLYSDWLTFFALVVYVPCASHFS